MFGRICLTLVILVMLFGVSQGLVFADDTNAPVITSDGLKPIVMSYKEKDKLYTGKVVMPPGEKTYKFIVKMGDKIIGSQDVKFNESVDGCKINFTYDPATNRISNDYILAFKGLDGKVCESSLYYNSRDEKYKKPFGAIPQGTTIKFTFEAKAHDLERVRLVMAVQKLTGNQESIEYLDKVVYPMKRKAFSKDGGREYWTTSVRFVNMNVYGYYFEAIDGNDVVVYSNNTKNPQVPNTRVVGLGGVGETYRLAQEEMIEDDIMRYRQTVYDQNFKTPDWMKDVIFYYIFPDRFKNGNKANDPKVGVRKYYGDSDIEFHTNWMDKKPWVPGDEDGCTTDDGEWTNDFYGGDLAGIIQKLDYLKELGINTIYSTPFFQAVSNYKYETTDYKKIDEAFGTNEEFKKLVQEAKKRGMRVILDASLNHSSSDSIYMDRYGRHPGLGAFENEKIRKDSPYYDWYEFNEGAENPDQAYNQWANPMLANLKESDSYKNFAYRDEDSVTKFWLDMGAAGWRMDVTPWVSDQFWREWRKELKEKNPDAAAIAETWFDSSKFLLGDMFDSTMNYIFRQAVYDYAAGKTGYEAVDLLEMVRENYPPEAFYSLMNLLSTHDAQRALYYFGYTDDRTPAEEIAAAKRRLILATFFQMTYPGAPAIYYGDEVGVTGGNDPYNRGPYPWKEDGGDPDENILKQYKKLTKLRNDNPVLRRGTLKNILVDDNVIVMLREYKGKVAIVATNNGDMAKTVSVNVSGLRLPATMYDALNSTQKVGISKGILKLEVPALFGRVLISK